MPAVLAARWWAPGRRGLCVRAFTAAQGILEAVWWRWPLRARRGVSVLCRVKVGAIVAVSALVGVGAALALL